MPTLSGTLRFWSEGEPPMEVALDRVEFVFEDTYEPSLIVEEIHVAQVAGRQVWYGEIRGFASGLTIKVEGAEHAELLDWVFHTVRLRSSPADQVETTTPGPSFVDSIFWDVTKTVT